MSYPIGGIKQTTVAVAATSASQQTLLTPTTGLAIRILSVQVVTSGLTTNPGRVGVYFGTGAAYTTTAANAIGECVPGTTGDEILGPWEAGKGPIGAVNQVVSGITETETETAMRYTIVYQEESL